MEFVALLVLSYAIFAFISDTFYLFRLDHYARRLSPYKKHKVILGYWCSSSLLLAGLLVSGFHGSLLEIGSLVLVCMLAIFFAAPAAAYYIFNRVKTGV